VPYEKVEEEEEPKTQGGLSIPGEEEEEDEIRSFMVYF